MNQTAAPKDVYLEAIETGNLINIGISSSRGYIWLDANISGALASFFNDNKGCYFKLTYKRPIIKEIIQ